MNWATTAESGREDLFDFAFDILGYDKLHPKIHREWCDWATDLSQLRKLRLEIPTRARSSPSRLPCGFSCKTSPLSEGSKATICAS